MMQGKLMIVVHQYLAVGASTGAWYGWPAVALTLIKLALDQFLLPQIQTMPYYFEV
jgi:hypothetical protein